MPGRLTTRSLRFGLVAGAALFAAVMAQPAPAQRAGPGTKIREVESLKMAYIYMAMANHDYDGHRGKAMSEIHKAIEILDRSIMKTGNNGLRQVALREEVELHRAKFMEKHQGKMHEPQAVSDAQMREAYTILSNVHPALVQLKQPAVRDHVGHAMHEIRIALKIH